jgi:hypothetical protein
VQQNGINCTDQLPDIEFCFDIETTYEHNAFNFCIVFHNLRDFTSLQYGLSWPEASMDCYYVPCGGDEVTGTIVSPGDGIVQTWAECQEKHLVIAGWGFLLVDGPGRVCPIKNPVTGLLAVTDCNMHVTELLTYSWHRSCAGVAGEYGDGPCGPMTDPPSSSWEGVNEVLR